MNVTWWQIYLLGLVASVWFFYDGGKRGGSTNPGLFSFLFGVVWPLTITILFINIIRSYRVKK